MGRSSAGGVKMAKPGVIGSSARAEVHQEVDPVVKQLRDLRNLHGGILALVSLAALALVFLVPRPVDVFIDFLGYTALGLLATIFGISWAVKSFRLIAPRER